MDGTVTHLAALVALTFLVALVYSSVGHGGASGYLALLSFFAFSTNWMATSALVLNLVVAGLAFWNFWKARHFCWNLTWPFALASIPASFAGSLVKISTPLYFLLLAFVLLFAAFRLLADPDPISGPPEGDRQRSPAPLLAAYSEANSQNPQAFSHPDVRTPAGIPARIFLGTRFPSLSLCLALGAGIGLLSCMVGVGGGIFLSPLLLLAHWSSPKQAGATAAFFVVVNSLAGLSGRLAGGHFELPVSSVFLLPLAAAFLGGLLGSYCGARRFSSPALKRILACLLFAASAKLLT